MKFGLPDKSTEEFLPFAGPKDEHVEKEILLWGCRVVIKLRPALLEKLHESLIGRCKVKGLPRLQMILILKQKSKIAKHATLIKITFPK